MQGYKPPEKVVICGAGVIGASVAYYLSLRGTAAVIVDRAGFVIEDYTSLNCWSVPVTMFTQFAIKLLF